jgi:2-oxoglutarate dehydrogenase E2 component (dihydrolipoamide succinyltransferase)
MAVVTMPQLGESVFEGTIGKWLVQEGDRVEKDQPLVEVLTDKADSELPAPSAGTITRILAQEGATIAVGQGLCEIDEAATSKKTGETKSRKQADTKSQLPPQPQPVQAKSSEPVVPEPPPPVSVTTEETTLHAPPSIRKAAREQGLTSGSTDNQPLTSAERAKALTTHGGAPMAKAPTPAAPQFHVPPYVKKPGDEVVPFTRRRRIIAEHMLYSKHTSPQVVTFAECDMHQTTLLRDANKKQLKSEGINLTYLAFVAAACARTLREYRILNARVLDDAYVLLKDINLGIAVDTPDGLVVPVIRNADELSVRGLAKAIDEIAERSREGKLTPDDLAGKTFTISNPGRMGNLVGGAIISQPNVGILRIGEIKKRVVVVEKDGEDLMAIHPIMHMALTYDHRIVDGVGANSFLYRIREILDLAEFEI